MLLQNSFEGGTNGTAISAANSGGASGDAFTGFVSNVTYTTAQAAHGTRSAAMAPDSTGWLEWSITAAATGSVYGRVNFRITRPTVGDSYVGLYLETLSSTHYVWQGYVVVHTDGTATLALQHYVEATDTNTIIASKTISVPNGGWCRLEFRADNSASSTAELRWYSSVDGTTITDSLTGTAPHTGVIGWGLGGVTADTFETSSNVWLDDLAISDTGYLGPAGITTVSKTGTDSGTLTNVATVAAALPRSDGASLVEQAKVGQGRTDTGGLAEQRQLQVALSRADTATVTSLAQVQVVHARADGGHLTEQATVQVAHTRTDGGTLVEGPRVIALARTDAATLGELSDTDQAFGPSTSDLAHLADQAAVAAALPRSDAATLAEQAAVHVLRYGTDTATLAETSLLAIPVTDTATLAELATITAVLTATDGTTLGELAQAIQPLVATDTMTLTETATVISLGGDITAVTPPYTDWAASYAFT